MRKDLDTWNLLIDAWRRFPNSPKDVQEMTGTSYLQATRALKEGWPEIEDFDARPIKIILEEEQDVLRSAKAMRSSPEIEAMFLEQETERNTLAETAEDEEKMVRSLRKTILGLSGSIYDLLPAVALLARTLAQEITDSEDLSPKDRAALLRQSIKVVQEGALAAKTVFELERMRTGKPIGTGTAAGNLPYEDAVRELSNLQRSIERSKLEH